MIYTRRPSDANQRGRERKITMLTKIFRIGPILVTLLMIAWTIAVYPYTDLNQKWAWYTVWGMFAGALLWHAALIFTQQHTSRWQYAFYAFLHIPVSLFITFWCVVVITKDGP